MSVRKKKRPKRDAIAAGVHLHSSVILAAIVIFTASKHKVMKIESGL